MYIKEVSIAGRTKEIRKYHTTRYNKPGAPRGPNKKPTRQQQKEINRRRAERKLRLLLNNNFGYGDYHLVLNYRKENRPSGKKAMKDDIQKFLRRLRTACKKQGVVLKYIHVMEIGKKGARHHHLVINRLPSRMIQDCWQGKGFIHLHPLDDTGQYKKLASYLLKYSDTYMNTDKELQGKRWAASRNLKQPIIKKQIMKRRTFRPEPATEKGYYIDKESIRSGIHEFTGHEYLEYTLVKDLPWDEWKEGA